MNVLKRTSEKPHVKYSQRSSVYSKLVSVFHRKRMLPWLMLIILFSMWLGSLLFVEAAPANATHEASVIGRIIDAQGHQGHIVIGTQS